jgi:hypothetical protein
MALKHGQEPKSWAGRVAQVVEDLSSKHEAMFKPLSAPKEKEKEKIKITWSTFKCLNSQNLF